MNNMFSVFIVFLRNVHPIIQVDPWAILATILWGVHSVAIFFFCFLMEVPLTNWAAQ